MPRSRVVVGGFSQGAAVALLMLRSELPLAGVLALSGFLPLAQEEPLVAGWEGMRAGGCDGAVAVVMRACVPRMCVEGLVRGRHAMFIPPVDQILSRTHTAPQLIHCLAGVGPHFTPGLAPSPAQRSMPGHRRCSCTAMLIP